MALPPLPESNTKRYFMLYTDGVNRHSVQVRVSPSVDDAAAVATLRQWAGQLSQDAYSTTEYDGLEVAALGSNVRNTVAWGAPIVGTIAGAMPGNVAPYSKNFRGRATSGRKTKMELFGLEYEQPADWQVPVAGTDLEDAYTTITTENAYFLTIDGSIATWKSDYLISVNDHWVKEARP